MNNVDLNMNKNKKQTLGRGLGSLLGDSLNSVESKPMPAAPLESVAANSVQQIPTYKLVPGPLQPRNHFDTEKLQELAASIKANGVLQPITVQKITDNKYEIVAGERRWRASQLAELQTVPCLIIDKKPENILELALIENIQREDLNPIELAIAFKRLSDDFGYTQAQISERVGKDRATVANLLRLLSLPREVIQLIEEQKVSFGHAKVLLSISDAETQIEMARKVEKQNLSVRALEKEIKPNGEAPPSLRQSLKEDDFKAVTNELQKLLGTSVEVKTQGAGGVLSIHFYSKEQFNELYERILGH